MGGKNEINKQRTKEKKRNFLLKILIKKKSLRLPEVVPLLMVPDGSDEKVKVGSLE